MVVCLALATPQILKSCLFNLLIMKSSKPVCLFTYLAFFAVVGTLVGCGASSTLVKSEVMQEVSVTEAKSVLLKDPVNDDKGPGQYIYPTDKVYKSGSFDLKQVTFKAEGSELNIDVETNSQVEDSWGMGRDFSVQTLFIFVDSDGNADNGNLTSVPGLNNVFAKGHGWDKMIVISPQPAGVQKRDLPKFSAGGEDVVIADGEGAAKGTDNGRAIVASVPLAHFGNGDVDQWRYQVVMQSNEGFPTPKDYFTRKVNEFEGQHRFGGGWDTNCDPHIIDVFAGDASGDDGEAQLQYDMLAYKCEGEGRSIERASLELVKP